MYNLDYRDEEEWDNQAIRKQLKEELRDLQMTRIAMWGKESFDERQGKLIDALSILEDVDIKGQRYKDTWEKLRAKGNN